jgi:hypothetical protein
MVDVVRAHRFGDDLARVKDRHPETLGGRDLQLDKIR